MRSLRFALTLAAASVVSLIPCRAQYSAPPVLTPPATAPSVLTTDPSLLYPNAPPFHLVDGDLLAIHVFGAADFAPTVRIDSNGDAELPFVGFVHLDGLTIPEAEKLIAKKLQDDGIYVDPLVTLTVTEGPNAVVTVVGENHGSYPLTGQTGLLNILNAAGGLQGTTSHVVTINRPGVPSPINIDLGTDPAHSLMANVPIFPGDIIVTGRVGVAFAIGAFKTPGVIQLGGNTPITLMQATAQIGGPMFEAKQSDLRLIRTLNGQRSVVKLDIGKIYAGKAPDPILEPNDILYLPTNSAKAILTSPGTGLVFSLSGLILSIANFARQ